MDMIARAALSFILPTLFMAAFMVMFMAAPVLAADRLTFRDQPRDAREDNVMTFLENSKVIFHELPFRIAAVDLNGDGVDEWIIRQDKQSNCEINASCEYAVVGLKQGQPSLLGRFLARNVGIDSYKTYGIRNILVYNKKNNDFDYSTYVWTPEKYYFLPRQ